MSQHARDIAKSLLDALPLPVASLSHLCHLLTPPLHALGLVDQHQLESDQQDGAQAESWSDLPLQDKLYILKVYWPQYQERLATKIVVDWHDQLSKEDTLSTTWLPYFCPSKSSKWVTDSIGQCIARTSISTLLIILSNKPAGHKLSSVEHKPAPLHPLVQSVAQQTLARVIQTYTFMDFFNALMPAVTTVASAEVEWRAFVDLYFSIPTRIANIPTSSQHPQSSASNLEWRIFHINASRQMEKIITSVSIGSWATTQVEALAYALGKIAKSGFMTFDKGHTTFWTAIMPSTRRSLLSPSRKVDTECIWQAVSAALSSSDFRTFSGSLLAFLEDNVKSSSEASAKGIAQASKLVESILGPLNRLDSSLWQLLVKKVFLVRAWQPCIAQILVSLSGTDSAGQTKLLETVIEMWQERDVIERAPTVFHTYLTSVILLLIRIMEPLDRTLIKISRSPQFLQAVTSHLSSMREVVRLEGMLVAEEVSQKSLPADGPVKALDFGDIWQGHGDSYESIRNLKAWLKTSADISSVEWELADDGETEGTIEDDEIGPSFTGNAAATPKPHTHAKPVASSFTPPAKSRKGLIQIMSSSSEYEDYDDIDEPDLQPYAMPPPPAPEDLEDLEDLSAYTPAKQKAKPPVYIADLCAYLKSTDDANKLEVGLREAAALIRRKANWGSELSDAAVELAFILSGLQDNFSLDHFEERRQEALNALMASAPERAAPAIIEQFFTNHYSIQQRSVMLVSLAIGARELAGLSVTLPDTSTSTVVDTSFPTQRLPGKLHDKFSARDDPSAVVRGDQLAVLTDDITNLALSRTRSAAEDKIPEASREKLLTVRETKRKVETTVKARRAAKPVTHRFTELAVGVFIMPLINRFWLYMRDVATSPQNFNTGIFRGGAAGSATLLDPMVLTRFLGTLTVLLEAGKRSPHFLAVLAPEALEVVLAIRGIDANNQAVQTSMLQLTLVVLEGSYELDGGRTLAREFSKTVWQIKDWAEDQWKQYEGQNVGSVGRAAAGVLLRLDDVVTKTIGYI